MKVGTIFFEGGQRWYQTATGPVSMKSLAPHLELRWMAENWKRVREAELGWRASFRGEPSSSGQVGPRD